MNIIKKTGIVAVIAALAFAFLMPLTPVYTKEASAADPNSSTPAATSTNSQIQEGINKVNPDNNSASLTTIIGDIIKTILFIVGILSVIMIIFGGIKYVTSAGDPSKVTSAKNTIVYAIVGLVVAIVAFAIVNFVISQLK